MYLRPLGYGVITDPTLPHAIEHDTATCNHCNRVFIIPARCSPEDAGGLCKVCMKIVCPQCAGIPQCTPWLEQLDRIEARNRALASYGL